MLNNSSKNKNNGLGYMINKQTKIQQQRQYKKIGGQRNKHNNKVQYKIADRQINKRQQKLVYIYRDSPKTFSFKCIHQTTDPFDIKGKTEQATVVQLEFSQSCVKTTRTLRKDSVNLV